MITVRAFDAGRDYSAVLTWWSAHRWNPVPIEYLPPRGFVAEASGKPVAAAWLYKTDSAFGWLEFLVTNPDSPRKARPEAVRAIVRTARKTAAEIGIEAIHTSLSEKTPGLKRLILKEGFVLCDNGMSNFIARVQ